MHKKSFDLLINRYFKLKTESFATLLRAGMSREEFVTQAGEELSLKLHDPKILQEASDQINSWQKAGIGMLTAFDPEFPKALLNIYDPPLILFYRGSLERLASPNRVSIVGARKADTLGLQIANQFSRALAERGILIVSGLALGIDSAAHRGALAVATNQVPTVAVLGNGPYQIYPRSNERLAREILDREGLICRSLNPKEAAYPSNFLNRNRVIAALSQSVLVIQASSKSGSLVTARYALEQGKDVLVVPGSITDPRYEGSNRLIQQGAYLVTSPNDLANFFPDAFSSANQPESEKQPLTPNQEVIVRVLNERQNMHHDELFNLCPTKSFPEDLLELEYSGLILRLPGNILSINARF